MTDRRGPPAVDRPSRGTGRRAAAPRRRAAPRARARARARRALHAPRPAAVGRRARRRARARPAPGGRRAAPVRPRRVGLPAPHAPRRRARAHPAPRDRDPRRALPRAARRRRRAARPRRRHRIGRDRARDRRRAPRRTGDRDRRVRGGPLARAGERGAHGPRGRAPVPRPLRRPAGRRLGPRRLQPAVRARRRARVPRERGRRLGARRWRSSIGGTPRRSSGTRHGSLRPGGALVLETHEDSASGVAALLDREGYVAVRTTKDLAGRDRVVEGRTPT